MEYKELAKLYHADASSSRDTEHARRLAQRLNAESTFRFGYLTRQGELFVAMPRELSVLCESIARTEHTLARGMAGLAGIARAAVLRGLVLDEVVSNNAIEEVRSTRRQVKDALDEVAGRPDDSQRFRELALLYLDVIDGRIRVPETPEDIRTIYDEVTRGEIPPDKRPDGVLFRAQGVDIMQGGARVVHRGLEPESRIVEALAQMLGIARDEETPALIRSVVAHYLFEHIHPFYDGNGRTGRYLLSLMLSDALSPATALCVSRGIAENRPEYYRAFKTAENPLNGGELTFFAHMMLHIVADAQAQLQGRLARCVEAQGRLVAAIGPIAEAAGLKPQEASIVLMLAQYEAFGLMGDAPLEEIAAYLQVKLQMARKHAARLEERGVLARRRKRNPLTFELTPAFKAQYGIDALMPPEDKLPFPWA